MNPSRKCSGITLVLGLGLLVGGVASATTVMTFDEMQHQPAELVDNYYNGGCSSSYSGSGATCGGPNYGVVWSSALAGGAPDGLWNNTANEPSGPNVMGFQDATGATMNVSAGFDTGFSFFYAAASTAGSITVYDGLNNSGNILATLFLPINGGHCGGFGQTWSCWSPIGVTFAGIARSVDFGGVASLIVFDNVTLGSGRPDGGNNVPEPATLGMFGLGMLLMGLFAGLRRRVH